MPRPATRAVLQHARELLAHPARWVHLCDAHDADGFPIDFADPGAARWSDLGAIRYAAYRLGAAHRDPRSVWPAIEAAERALHRAYLQIDALLGPPTQPDTDRSAYLTTVFAFELAIAHHAPTADTTADNCRVPDPGRS